MSRKKIKRRTFKPRPRGQDARREDIGRRRQAEEVMRLSAKMESKKLEEAEREADRVRAAEAAAEAIKKMREENKVEE